MNKLLKTEPTRNSEDKKLIDLLPREFQKMVRVLARKHSSESIRRAKAIEQGDGPTSAETASLIYDIATKNKD